ncbi:MAG TPA: hypothetical protein VH722_04480 [Alphaproteobacteria bacterium]|nr:hypothetical protein [Alphaproteobacteria bacterium]
MLRNFVLAAGALTMVAGFAMAQEVQQTTTSSQAVTTPGAPDINAQAAAAAEKARAQAKPGEEYEWSVDNTTTHVPVRPAPPPPPPMVEHHHTQTTTTTTQGGDQ